MRFIAAVALLAMCQAAFAQASSRPQTSLPAHAMATLTLPFFATLRILQCRCPVREIIAFALWTYSFPSYPVLPA